MKIVQKFIQAIKSKEQTQKNPSKKGLKFVILGLIAIQVLLTVSVYNAAAAGLINLSILWFGLNLLVYAALFLVYQSAFKNKKILDIQ